MSTNDFFYTKNIPGIPAVHITKKKRADVDFNEPGLRVYCNQRGLINSATGLREDCYTVQLRHENVLMSMDYVPASILLSLCDYIKADSRS